MPNRNNNKTLYGALTRWGYLNTHITAHDTYSIQKNAIRNRESLLNFLAIPRKPLFRARIRLFRFARGEPLSWENLH